MPALLGLNPYVDVIVALALSFLCLKLAQALFRPLEGLPVGIGSAIKALERAIAQSISHTFGVVAGGASHAVGGSFHAIATLVNLTARVLTRGSLVLAEGSALLGHFVDSLHGIEHGVRDLQKARAGIGSDVSVLKKEYHGIDKRVKTLERDISTGIGHDLRIQVKALQKEYTGLRHTVTDVVQPGLSTAEGELTQLQQWLGVKVGVNQKAWAIALATTLLGAVGLGNLRCSNFGGLLNKYACGLGKLIDDLLGLAIAGIALEAVCEFLPLLEAAFGAVVGPITHLLNEVPLGACEQVPQGWSVLNVSAGPLPPAQTLGTFPS